MHAGFGAGYATHGIAHYKGELQKIVMEKINFIEKHLWMT